MTDVRLFGYADPLAARMGDPVDFMISAEGAKEAQIDIVRLVHGDYNPLGPGFIEEVVQTDLPATLAVQRQYTQNGSFARVAVRGCPRRVPLRFTPLSGDPHRAGIVRPLWGPGPSMGQSAMAWGSTRKASWSSGWEMADPLIRSPLMWRLCQKSG